MHRKLEQYTPRESGLVYSRYNLGFQRCDIIDSWPPQRPLSHKNVIIMGKQYVSLSGIPGVLCSLIAIQSIASV